MGPRGGPRYPPDATGDLGVQMGALVPLIVTFLCPQTATSSKSGAGSPCPATRSASCPPPPAPPSSSSRSAPTPWVPGSGGALGRGGTGPGHLSPVYQGSPVPRLNIPGCGRTAWGPKPPRNCTPGSAPCAGGHRPCPGEWGTGGFEGLGSMGGHRGFEIPLGFKGFGGIARGRRRLENWGRDREGLRSLGRG